MERSRDGSGCSPAALGGGTQTGNPRCDRLCLFKRELEAGYRQAYREFYSWSNILRSTARQESLLGEVRHFAYKTAWKKFEPFWDLAIRLKRLSALTPLLEKLLSASSSPPKESPKPEQKYLWGH